MWWLSGLRGCLVIQQLDTQWLESRREQYLFFIFYFFQKMFKYAKFAQDILKAKSNFTLLLYIPYLGIGEWYFKCV